MIFHANAATCMPGHALELLVPALMPPRACAVHARHMHARRWHRMGDKCTPAAPNQLLTGIQALLMQSSCLFRLNSADNAACAHRYTDAQPCLPPPRACCKRQKSPECGEFLAARISQIYQVPSAPYTLFHSGDYDTDSACQCYGLPCPDVGSQPHENTQAPFPTDRLGDRSRPSHTSIARRALS